MAKSEDAFRTIGELSEELGVAQHILRYWETRFPQLRPMQRAGKRRYYRPADAALVRRIHCLLNEEGYTIKGVQRVLADKSAPASQPPPLAATLVREPPAAPTPLSRGALYSLQAIRDDLARALAEV